MVDELILTDIRSIIAKLLIYKKITDINQLISKAGISKKDVTDDEILDLLAAEYLTVIEIAKYRQYRAYKRKKDLEVVSNAVVSLQDTTNEVNALYERKSGIDTQIRGINQEIFQLKMKFPEIPRVRIRTMYSGVARSYDAYSSRCIKAGMHEADVKNAIEKINYSNIIVRSLKSGKVKRLQEELREYTKRADARIKSARGIYIAERNKYYLYLKEVICDLLKNKQIANALLLSAKMWAKDEIVALLDYRSVPKLTSQELNSIDNDYVVDKFFDYFETQYEEKFDGDSFCQALEDFILYYYNELVKRLGYQKQKCYDDIQKAFAGQREIMMQLNDYSDAFSSFEEKLTDDQNDTYALVYANVNK